MYTRDQSAGNTVLGASTIQAPPQHRESDDASRGEPGADRLADGSAHNSPSHIIEICGASAWVSPPAVDLLEPILSCSTPQVGRGRKGNVEVVFERLKFFRISADGSLWALSGFVERIRSALVQAGRSVEIRQSPGYLERKAPDREVLGALASLERRYAEVILQRQRAQFVVVGQDALRLYDTTCRLFPLSRIVIVALNRRRIREIQRYLQSRRRELVSAVGGPGDDEAARIQIVSVYHFGTVIINPRGVDLLLLDDAGLVANAQQSIEAVGWLRDHYIYGFRPQASSRSRSERMWLEGLCGPIVPHPGSSGGLRRPPVRTVFVTPPEYPTPPHSDELGRKRAAIWHAQRRNHWIAELARALADRHHVALMQLGLVDIGDYYFARLNIPSVAILVESVAHARALARLLPGWPIVSACPTAGGVGDPPQSRHCIVTLQAARHYQTLHVDAIIIATGVAPCELPTLLPGSYGFPPEILLIDLADDFDRLAREHACDRANDYYRRGWPVEHPPAEKSTRRPDSREGERRPRTRVSRSGARRSTAK
jgi:hypothetical protein